MDDMHRIGAWGDLGNGYYRNPVLLADYSDPDVCRVGEDYYMTCSEFNYMGMPILHSRDLVNWTLVGRVFDRFPGRAYDDMQRYGRGSWAPSIRYHDGLFHIYFCTPDEGLFLARAKDASGPWELLHIHEAADWEDPCPYWDKAGNAWLSRSQLGAGPIYLHRMSPDGTRLLDEGCVIFEGDGAEGPKWYDTAEGVLLMFPQGGTSMGWQMAMRGPTVEGPFEAKCVCRQGATWTNGPHQGALVDTVNGEWWFLHFSKCGVTGRVVHLQPVTMVDGWPVIGERTDEEYCGQPVWQHRKPALLPQPLACTATSDDFSAPDLGLQWQWNHNPEDDRWSLSRHPGRLSLRGVPEKLPILEVRNMLTQRLVGANMLYRVQVCTAEMKVGQQAGLVMLGRDPFVWCVTKEAEGLCVTICCRGQGAMRRTACVLENDGPWLEKHQAGPFAGDSLWLQLSIQQLSELRAAYSADGVHYVHIRHDAFMIEGVWKGVRPALFTNGGDGWAEFADFRCLHDGPCGRG